MNVQARLERLMKAPSCALGNASLRKPGMPMNSPR